MRKPTLVKLIRPYFLSSDVLKTIPEAEVHEASDSLLRDWCATAGLFEADDREECVAALLDWQAHPSQEQNKEAPRAATPSSGEPPAKAVIPEQERSRVCVPISLVEASLLETHELIQLTHLLPGGQMPDGARRVEVLGSLIKAGLVLEGSSVGHPPIPPSSSAMTTGQSNSGMTPQSYLRFMDNGEGRLSTQPHIEDTRVLSLLTQYVPNRLSDLLGPAGKYSSDCVCGNVLVYLFPDDRRALGIKKAYLKYLLGLLFVMDFSREKSPSGIHLQAFNGNHGEEFYAVHQVHTALSRVARILDCLVCPPQGPFIFQPILDPTLRLLQAGDIGGLQRLPVEIVVDAVSESLMKMGHAARSASNDRLSREDLIMKLSEAATVDVTAVIHRASVLNFAHQGRGTSRDFSRKRSRSPGRGTPHRHQPWEHRRSTTAGGRHGSKRQSRHNLCMAALRKHLNISDKGCQKTDCLFSHEFTGVSKDVMLEAADSFFKAEVRAKARTAVLSLYGQ